MDPMSQFTFPQLALTKSLDKRNLLHDKKKKKKKGLSQGSTGVAEAIFVASSRFFWGLSPIP